MKSETEKNAVTEVCAGRGTINPQHAASIDDRLRFSLAGWTRNDKRVLDDLGVEMVIQMVGAYVKASGWVEVSSLIQVGWAWTDGAAWFVHHGAAKVADTDKPVFIVPDTTEQP